MDPLNMLSNAFDSVTNLSSSAKKTILGAFEQCWRAATAEVPRTQMELDSLIKTAAVRLITGNALDHITNLTKQPEPEAAKPMAELFDLTLLSNRQNQFQKVLDEAGKLTEAARKPEQERQTRYDDIRKKLQDLPRSEQDAIIAKLTLADVVLESEKQKKD